MRDTFYTLSARLIFIAMLGWLGFNLAIVAIINLLERKYAQTKSTRSKPLDDVH